MICLFKVSRISFLLPYCTAEVKDFHWRGESSIRILFHSACSFHNAQRKSQVFFGHGREITKNVFIAIFFLKITDDWLEYTEWMNYLELFWIYMCHKQKINLLNKTVLRQQFFGEPQFKIYHLKTLLRRSGTGNFILSSILKLQNISRNGWKRS